MVKLLRQNTYNRGVVGSIFSIVWHVMEAEKIKKVAKWGTSTIFKIGTCKSGKEAEISNFKVDL